jgi:CRP/FNR family transcriptional regulator
MATSSVVRETCHRAFADPCAELVEHAGLGVTISVGVGRTIVTEGDPIEHVYRILSGSVRLYKAVSDGRRQIIDFLGAKDCFGLMDVDEYAYSVEAITDVVMVRYQRHRLEVLMEEHPELSQQLFRLACAELQRAQRRMLLLGRKSAEERVASFLLDLAEQQQAGDGGEVRLAMSRQDIADHLGLTIETVSRIFTRLKAAGLIRLPDRHAVRLSDVDRLAHMADCGPATI